MPITTDSIQKLRAATGAGIMDAKKALEEAGGNFDKAVEIMRKHGQKIAAKKQDRQTKEGVIGTYVHANHKVVAIVALACESDFVGKHEEFQELAHDIAMQIAATDPHYIAPANVPAEIVAKEREIFQSQLQAEGKPEKIWENILTGKLEKFYSEVCLVRQPFIKDDAKTIEALIQEKVLKFGENIQIREFKRMAL
jgi:elongation factor Ts